MKKKILAIACCCTLFQACCAMDGKAGKVYGSFKDALLGNKRNIHQEIQEAQTDTNLSPAQRAKTLGRLYCELRNKHRGTPEYGELNKLMCTYNQQADILEKEEAQAAQLQSQQNERAVQEKKIQAKIDELKCDKSSNNVARWDEIIDCYTQLKTLFEGVDKEKYNLYEAHRNNLADKKEYFALSQLAQNETNKSQKAQLLRQMSQLCTKQKKKNALTKQADDLEKEDRYEVFSQQLVHATDLTQKAKLHRILVYYSEQHAQQNLTLAQQYEEQAAKEQEQHLATIAKIAKITGLNAEIIRNDANKDKLSPFVRLKTLAQLMEERYTVSQELPHFKSQFENDMDRVQKLRRQAIAFASNEAERRQMIALLN